MPSILLPKELVRRAEANLVLHGSVVLTTPDNFARLLDAGYVDENMQFTKRGIDAWLSTIALDAEGDTP